MTQRAPAAASTPAAEGEEDPVEVMRREIAELQARAEHDAPALRVRHILISFAGLKGVQATRSREQAERLAAELLRDIRAGADFAVLMKKHSDDPGPGVYGMFTSGTPSSDTVHRKQMVGAFGDVAWRLKPNEVGVAPADKKTSPFGWHIIQRIE